MKKGEETKEPTWLELIPQALDKWYPLNNQGGRVIELPTCKLIQKTKDGGVEFSPAFVSDDPDALFYQQVYTFLQDNSPIAPRLVLDAVVELADWEKLNWKKPPVAIKSVDGVEVGKWGIAYHTKSRGNSRLALILISADGSWTTLTIWTEKNPDEIGAAREDIQTYRRVLEEMEDFI